MVRFNGRGNREQRYSPWLQCLIIGYVLFLAGGLPFICWGALADPAHPHRGPHFVFTDPPGHAPGSTTPTVDPRVRALLESDCGSLQVGFAPPPALAAALGLDAAALLEDAHALRHNGEHDAAQPAGQSLPASLLSLLLLAIVHIALLVVHARTTSTRIVQDLFRILPPLPVPTPPPRPRVSPV